MKIKAVNLNKRTFKNNIKQTTVFLVLFMSFLIFNLSVIQAESKNSERPVKIKPGKSRINYIDQRISLYTKGIITENEMTKTDRKILKLCQDAANECRSVLEDAIIKGIKTKKEIFSTLYFPVYPLKSPRTFSTFYDDYTDKHITPVEDEYLKKDKKIIFVVLVDKNGYLPSHNTRFSKTDASSISSNRTKRIFNDLTGYSAANNVSSFLLQIYYRDTGEVIADVSVPVFVNDIHWGALRIGYKR
ncbi:MAG: hypothetical protein GY730_12000 [bacterium]|nr:hypothetical protein [bacterium]